MLFDGELEVTTDEDTHPASGTGRLAIDGGDTMLTLLEGEIGEFGHDVLRALDLLTFEGQHRTFLVEICKAGTIRIEGAVVVLDEGLGQGVRIHPIPVLKLRL
ncbi:hypothetical protein SLE2022_048270 [Rubroshorea leprosula]